ncbi:MAG TPA: sensor histidine kinase [Terrimesophilobacter sp.]|nr:sensor histidine kinase [Terrimesophilobacter sp.]
MKPTGWWSVVVIAVATTLAVFLSVTGYQWSDAWGAWVSLVAFVVVYFAYGHTAVREPRGPHDLILTLLNGGILALGTAFQPTMAILQTAMFPLVWYTARSLKAAYLLNPVIALGSFVGIWLFSGWDDPWLAILTSALSLAFSLAMGAWISSIARHGEERSRLLDELQAVQGELADRNQEAGAAAERERIARELHDTIAQNLTAIVMHAQRLEKRDRGGRPVAADDLALIESLASEALTETRTLVATMAPVAIESGLEDALQRLAERFTRETGVAVTVNAGSFDREREVIVLRCAQEGLANVRKHAQATAVDLRVTMDDLGAVTLTVEDNGVGLPAAAGEGFGLPGMRARVAAAGGTLYLLSTGAGTLLTATIPEGS